MHNFIFESDSFKSSRLIWRNAETPNRGNNQAKPVLQSFMKKTRVPRRQPRRAPSKMSNKQLFNKVIDKLPPGALNDMKGLMLQAVDLMDDATVNKAANEYAKKQYGALGQMGAGMTNATYKRGVVKRMIQGARTMQDIKKMIAGVSDASFDGAVNKAMSNSKAVQKMAMRPGNTFIAKRLAGAVLNRMHPVHKKQAMLQIINESSPHDFRVMKWMIGQRIRKASSKDLKLMAAGTHDKILKQKFGSVGGWFVDIVYHMGLVPDSTIKGAAIKHLGKMNKNQLLAMVNSMNPKSVSGMLNMSLNSWGINDSTALARNPRAQADAARMGMRSAKTIMRYP